MGKKEMTFEQAVSRIDKIVKMLEEGDVQLEKSLSLFEEGVKLTQICGTMLEEAEKKIVSLQKAIGEQPKEFFFDDE